MEKTELRYRGRIAQVGIYVKKFARMFVYQNDWKMLLMAALIAGLVSIAVGANLFKTQEGAATGCFAVVCVCVWNGFFNSIQVICRERGIIKREHRAGMHISSYIGAHMIWQAVLCLAQTVIFLLICLLIGVEFPTAGLITGVCLIDIGISMFLITYAADMMALMVSSLVKTAMTAMTVMPFLLIFELVFSGELIKIDGLLAKLKGLTIVKWGQQCLCTLGNYNEMPMVSMWNMLWKFRSFEMEDGSRPIEMITDYILETGQREQVLLESGKYNMNPEYLYSAATIWKCWGALLVFIIVFAVFAVIFLRGVDKDKR